MRSIVTVVVPSDESALTTLERVKRELSITGTDANRDQTLTDKINEASSDIEAALGFRVPQEDVTETFWHEAYEDAPSALVLDRTPVVSIASVVVDGVTMDPSRYRVDASTGELFALDVSGYPCVWIFIKGIVATYTGGFSLPIEEGQDATLPPGIQGACLDLISSFWSAKGRDPTVRAEEIPGVIRKEFWVGAVGEAGELPPSVVMKLAPFRRVNFA